MCEGEDIFAKEDAAFCSLMIYEVLEDRGTAEGVEMRHIPLCAPIQ